MARNSRMKSKEIILQALKAKFQGDSADILDRIHLTVFA